ncbi:hypothetical protein FB567DRAFT_618611 [Paraphoma chrysanthemicola]|uniref:BTB domain-containing protein n=1 Tax=Paraphoma chrysanthemicola TaxID=798071 RepID=A0A8K0R8T3_9PLEO|nr:hypothetical protein FB567DRAFT_618611 [Paraphoma chrysanthemicola]
MLSHSQHDQASEPSARKTVAFILPGRKTLSENLPAETIDVHIAIARRSPYLRELIEQSRSELGNGQAILLRQTDSMGFRFYVEWLHLSRIEFHAATTKTTGTGLLLRDCFDLIFAHIVGSQFDEPNFQDYIIDIMTQSIDISQTPDLKVLEVVFLEKGASPVLQRFVVDKMFAVERRMLGMIRGSAVVLRNCTASCEYHVHGEGQCYRAEPRFGASRKTNTFDSGEVPPSEMASRTSSLTVIDQDADHGTATSRMMSNQQYFESIGWSNKTHGVERRRTLDPSFEKPLPPIPPLTPGTSPSPLSSTPSHRSKVSTDPSILRYLNSLFSQQIDEPTSIRELVLECLNRLSRVPTSMEISKKIPEILPTVPIPELVLECIERYENNPSGSARSRPASSIQSPCSFHGSSRGSPTPSPPANYEPLTPSNNFARGTGPIERRYDDPRHNPLQDSIHISCKPNLEKPPPHAESSLSLTEQPKTHHSVHSTHQNLLLAPSPARSSTVSRKPVPPRGTDWLKQYDRINSLIQHAPAHTAT